MYILKETLLPKIVSIFRLPWDTLLAGTNAMVTIGSKLLSVARCKNSLWGRFVPDTGLICWEMAEIKRAFATQ